MPVITEPREAYLFRGKNGLETCIALSEQFGNLFTREKLMELDKVKEILQRLNEEHISYAIIGGMALAHYCPPRTTQDLDLMVFVEEAGKVREMFKSYYLHGNVIAGIYDYEGTRFDVLPASRRLQREVISHAIDSYIDALSVKVARVQDLILLKLIAAPNRPQVGKRAQDQADVVQLIEYNSEQLTAEDIAHICDSLLQQVYSIEDRNKFRQTIQWLNQTLDELNLSNLKYQLLE